MNKQTIENIKNLMKCGYKADFIFNVDGEDNTVVCMKKDNVINIKDNNGKVVEGQLAIVNISLNTKSVKLNEFTTNKVNSIISIQKNHGKLSGKDYRNNLEQGLKTFESVVKKYKGTSFSNKYLSDFNKELKVLDSAKKEESLDTVASIKTSTQKNNKDIRNTTFIKILMTAGIKFKGVELGKQDYISLYGSFIMENPYDQQDLYNISPLLYDESPLSVKKRTEEYLKLFDMAMDKYDQERIQFSKKGNKDFVDFTPMVKKGYSDLRNLLANNGKMDAVAFGDEFEKIINNMYSHNTRIDHKFNDLLYTQSESIIKYFMKGQETDLFKGHNIESSITSSMYHIAYAMSKKGLEAFNEKYGQKTNQSVTDSRNELQDEKMLRKNNVVDKGIELTRNK